MEEAGLAADLLAQREPPDHHCGSFRMDTQRADKILCIHIVLPSGMGPVFCVAFRVPNDPLCIHRTAHAGVVFSVWDRGACDDRC